MVEGYLACALVVMALTIFNVRSTVSKAPEWLIISTIFFMGMVWPFFILLIVFKIASKK